MEYLSLVCNCKNIEPFFLDSIERGIGRLGVPEAKELKGELLAKLKELAEQCGYERDEHGAWVQFPKQEKALESLGAQYEIIKQHDDGDLTIKIPEHHAMAVVTTEGEVFTKPD